MVQKQSHSDRPFPTVAAYIFDNEGRLFLLRSPKWNNKLVPPGGHIEYGEKAEDALWREVKEETGFEIKNPQLLTTINMIEEEDFIPGKRHFVGLEFKAELSGDREPKLDQREGSEYIWERPEAIVKRADVERWTKCVIAEYLSADARGRCGQCAEYKAGWQRAQADYLNLQKDAAKRRADWAQRSEQEILQEFLPVYDNFKKAFSSAPGVTSREQNNWVKGIEYIMKQLGDILKTHGVEEIKTAGERFDPTLHEIVGEEINIESDEGVIVKEVEGGYMMNGKVMKVAKVVVGKDKGEVK